MEWGDLNMRKLGRGQSQKASAYLIRPAALLRKQTVSIGTPLSVHLEIFGNRPGSRERVEHRTR